MLLVKRNWFPITLVGIFLFSLFLRFWNLGKFNTLVFDEVYYAKFANNYLTGTSFFNVHPPLGQYLIAIGIWLGSHFSFPVSTVNDLTGSMLSTISYRWLNAFTGSFIPLLIGAIAYQLTHRRSYAAIATLFAALDGFFLVESRYALPNIYLIFFGLLGQLFFLLAVNNSKKNRRIWQLIFSGIFLACSASVKWNGLGFLLGIYLVWAIAWLWKLIRPNIINRNQSENKPNLVVKITRINLFHIIFFLGIIPALTYRLIWIPHLLMNPKYNFSEIHQQIIVFHEKLGNGTDIHRYCSSWYTWLLMFRPIAYFYKKIHIEELGDVVYDVHAIGNPLLWWLSTAAIGVLLLILLINLLAAFKHKNNFGSQNFLAIYLVANYAANLLPWIKVSRCTFIYLYMGALVFSWLALAWLVDELVNSKKISYRRLGIIIIIAIVFAFEYWLPFYLGLSLSPEGWQRRMLFPNWI